MALSVQLLLAGVLVFAGYRFVAWQRYRAKQYSNGCAPPRAYPHTDPLFGIDLFIETGKMFEERRFLPTLHERYAAYGPTFEVSTLGTPTVCSADPINLQSVFGTNAEHWGVQYRLPSLGPYCGSGFLTVDGKEWERSRSLLAPALHQANVTDHTDYAGFVDALIRKLPSDDATSVDLQPLIFMLYLDSATLWLFGESFDSLEGKGGDKVEAFLHSFGYSLGIGGFRMALGPLSFLHYSPKWHASNKSNHQFIDRYVDRAIARETSGQIAQEKAAGKSRPILMDEMAQITHDREDLRNQAIQAFIAAHETTACLISNVLWVLARHPAIWAELRREVIEELGDAPLDFKQPMKLRQLRNVINETLRLYPVFPYHIRVALVDTTIPTGGGPHGDQPIFCRAGSYFDGNFAVLHRQESIWGKDAAAFDPARWDRSRPTSSEFMPFGGGPRACAGRLKSLMETSYFVVRMLRAFQTIEPADARDWQGEVQVTAKNLHGCKVRLGQA